ncbi:MAG: SPOR domain-containing protein [Deltaproteobacteria bacterium]|nr:SPOR domain-containing protein [Deltaproteobacteria bacterium]
MDFKFSKGGEENSQAEPAAEKKNQSAILALLVILVGGFSYVYFFTGIIKPQEAGKPAETAETSQVVKMPLPPRDGDAAKADAKPADVKPADAKPEVVPPPKAEPAKPAPAAPVAVAVPAPAPAPAAKPPVQPAVKPKEEPKKAEPVKPKEEPRKAEPVKSAEKKPAAAESKPAAADKKAEPAKTETKKAAAETAPKAAVPAKPAKSAAAASAGGGVWSILVGSYVLEDALSADMGRVRKAGLEPVVKAGPRKKTTMNRLYVSEFADRAEAQAVLDKLKRHTSDAFIVDQAGKHTVYAGSYLLDTYTATEMERLRAAGFQVSLKRTEVTIPSQSVTLGPYKDKKAADAALGKLKAAGVKATLSQQ